MCIGQLGGMAWQWPMTDVHSNLIFHNATNKNAKVGRGDKARPLLGN